VRSDYKHNKNKVQGSMPARFYVSFTATPTPSITLPNPVFYPTFLKAFRGVFSGSGQSEGFSVLRFTVAFTSSANIGSSSTITPFASSI